ncbi:hypothetical protein [Salisediminibacterium beveridgei]|uniref:Uncharacterized protein n=1 Tax=Salisediminibacterium beveridgei TaxID=632773 RepID=A0A1D7QYK9_9BACI|nr:hypothetical protein [Salisediminibacterium beveridgei]AOM84082.1 hypothetical protein BBEV_2745 [Salisediminibacterium beveridgei]
MKNNLIYGVIAGLTGGLIFGILMQMMGMIEMIAMMAGSSSLFVGWLIHMIISIVFGVSFTVLAPKFNNLPLFTILFGVVIWVIGPLVIMPMMLGMGTMLMNAFAMDQLMSLGTHLFFAVIVAVVYKLLTSKAGFTNTIPATK